MNKLIRVSPKYILHPLIDKIYSSNSEDESFDCSDERGARLVFQDRMQGWFFDPAQTLNIQEKSIAAVHIVTPLIEALRCYKMGRPPQPGESGTFFTDQAKDIFPLLQENEEALNLLYKGVRCGFAHQGFIKNHNDSCSLNVLISTGSNSNSAIEYNKPVMTINASLYIKDINEAYNNYFQELDEDNTRLSDFFQMWKHQWRIKKDKSAEMSGEQS